MLECGKCPTDLTVAEAMMCDVCAKAIEYGQCSVFEKTDRFGWFARKRKK